MIISLYAKHYRWDEHVARPRHCKSATEGGMAHNIKTLDAHGVEGGDVEITVEFASLSAVFHRHNERHGPIDSCEPVLESGEVCVGSVAGEKVRIGEYVVVGLKCGKLRCYSGKVYSHCRFGLELVGASGYGVGQRRAVGHDYQPVAFCSTLEP